MPDSIEFLVRALLVLTEPDSIEDQEREINDNRPPLGAIAARLNEALPNMTKGQRSTVGKLQRRVLEWRGYAHDRYNVRIKKQDAQHRCGSTYRKIAA